MWFINLIFWPAVMGLLIVGSPSKMRSDFDSVQDLSNPTLLKDSKQGFWINIHCFGEFIDRTDRCVDPTGLNASDLRKDDA